MNDFSKNLKFLREKKGLKQADMLAQLGFKQTTWNNYERGIAYPTIMDMVKICTFFMVNIDDILHKDLSAAQHPYMVNEEPEKYGKDYAKEQGKEDRNKADESNKEITAYKLQIEYLEQLAAQKEQTIQAQAITIKALQSMLDQSERE
jgi:transcriptional regulator with XRE-family HTH domain